jgi:hypothetical protein
MTEDNLKEYRDLAEKIEDEYPPAQYQNYYSSWGGCPSCGYCPHCGRGNSWPSPQWPTRPYITWGTDTAPLTVGTATAGARSGSDENA